MPGTITTRRTDSPHPGDVAGNMSQDRQVTVWLVVSVLPDSVRSRHSAAIVELRPLTEWPPFKQDAAGPTPPFHYPSWHVPAAMRLGLWPGLGGTLGTWSATSSAFTIHFFVQFSVYTRLDIAFGAPV